MEIKYCSKCRSRVSSVDIASRKGIETPDGKLFCDTCAQEENLYEQYPETPAQEQPKQSKSLTGQFRALQAEGLKKEGTGAHKRVRRTGTGKHKTGTGKHKTGTGAQRRVRRRRPVPQDGEVPVTETGRIRRRKLQEAMAESEAPAQEDSFEPEALSPEEFFASKGEEFEGKEKSQTPLLIILTVIAAGLLGAIIVVIMGRGGSNAESGMQNAEQPGQQQKEKQEKTPTPDKKEEAPVVEEKKEEKTVVEKKKEEPLKEMDGDPEIVDEVVEIPGAPEKKFPEADGWTSFLSGDWKESLTPLRSEWDYGGNMLRVTTVKGEPSPFIETSTDYEDHKAGFTFAASGNVNFEFMFGKEGKNGGSCLVRVPEPGVWHNLTWEIKEAALVNVQLNGKDILTDQTAQFKVYKEGMNPKGKISINVTPYDQKNVLSVKFAEIAITAKKEETADTGEGDAAGDDKAKTAGIWIEGENPSTSNVLKHNWYDAGQKDLMSGKNWLSHYSQNKDTVGTVAYKFKVQGGNYAFWLRTVTSASRVHYQIDGGGFKEISFDKKQDTVNMSPKQDHRWVSWVKVGQVDLKEGEHTVEFKFDGDVHMSGAIDCFTFTTDTSYSPTGILQPKDAGGPAEVIAIEKPKPKPKPISTVALGDEVQGMLFGDDFENWAGENGLWSEAFNNKGKIERSTAAARSGKRSLKSSVSADKAGAYLKAKIKPATSCYVRMMMYLEPGWDETFANKGDNAFLLRVKTASNKGIYFYIRKDDNHQVCFQAHTDDGKYRGAYVNGKATPGQWMHIEIYCPPTGPDMEFKIWVNGKEKKWKGSMVGLGPWETVEVGFTGVKKGARPVAYIDDVIVSSEYVGPTKSVGEVLTAKTDWIDVYSDDFEGKRSEGSKYITEKKYAIDKRSAKAPKASRGDSFELKGIIGIPDPAPISKNARVLISYYTDSSKVEIRFIGKDGDGNPFEALVRPDPPVKDSWVNLELLVFDLEITKGTLSDSVKIDTVIFEGGTEDERRPSLYIDNLKIQK